MMSLLNPELAVPAVKAAVASASAAGAAGYFKLDPYVAPFFGGVGFTVIGMSVAGALFSFAFGSSERNRPKLFFQAIAASFIGAAAVTWVPEIFDVANVTPAAQPVAGFFYALFARWFMPLVIDILPMLVRRWFNIPAKAEDQK